jgi:hypothetical protein
MPLKRSIQLYDGDPVSMSSLGGDGTKLRKPSAEDDVLQEIPSMRLGIAVIKNWIS